LTAKSNPSYSPARFLLLLSVFAVAVLLQQALLPVMEGGDEYLHYGYVQFLLSQNRLPERENYLTNTTRQQSGQPPLAYWTASLLLRLLNVSMSDEDMSQRLEQYKNPWYSPANRWNRMDNRNLLFHGGGQQAIETPAIERATRIMRLPGLVFGVLAVVAAYLAAREVFSSEKWVLVATACFAFTPQLVHLSAFLNTDIPMIAFATLALWQTLRLLRHGSTRGRLLLIGLFLALSMLSKVNGALIIPPVGLALLIEGYRRNLPIRGLVLNGLQVALPIVVLFGSWVLYGWLSYQDPLGTKTHLRPGYFYDQPLQLVSLVPLLPEVYYGYWGKLASDVYLHPATYALLTTLPILSLLGYALWLKSRLFHLSNLPTPYALVLGLAVLVGTAGLIHWLQTIQFITGRLMFQTHIAVAVGITGGLYLLSRRFLRRVLPLYACGVLLGAGLIAGPTSLYSAYAPPTLLTHEQLPPLEGQPVDFAQTIRFLGYQQVSANLQGDLHTVTLCWEVLQATERPAAFSIKLVQDGNIVADRTSVFGLGRFDSDHWQPGDIFCDRVAIPLSNTIPAGQTYDMLLVVLNARTQAVDWQATDINGIPIQFPFIGKVSRLAKR
jgi:hypothetical protein